MKVSQRVSNRTVHGDTQYNRAVQFFKRKQFSNNVYNTSNFISLPLHGVLSLGKHFSRHSVTLIVHSMQWV